VAQGFSTSDSPQGWSETTFGELVRSIPINDKKLPTKQYAESGKFPVVDQGQKFIGGYSDDEDRVVTDELPLIVFGDHTRIFKYLDRAFVPGADGIKVLKPIGVDEKWLFHIAHALDFPDKGYARHFQHLKQATVFVPPLPEQRRIVARIEEIFSRLDAGVAALRHAKAQLQRYRQSVLAAAVTGQLTQAWREQHPDTVPASETVAAMLRDRQENWERKGKYSPPEEPPADLDPLPEKWCWATWDQLSHWVTYGFTRPMEHVDDGVPIVTAKHVKDSRINYEEGHRTPQMAYDDLSEKDRPKPGDILVTKDGTIGRAAVVESDQPFCINQSVAVVWLRTCPMYRKYLLTTIETQSAQRQMSGKARGVAIKHLSITDFAKMSVPIPPPAEQQRIVAEVEARTTAIDHLEAELDRQITRSNRLRQSTLNFAFRGKLA
jgi:type I restriction enzyme S subunit